LPTQLNLVGGFNPSEKYERQLGLFFPIYGKIIQMFQTTNQQFNLLCWKPIWPMTITFSGKVETFQMFHHQVGLLEMTENPALSLHQKVFLLD
jgi:hypothetical protein